jgi:hypothetical protein
MTLNLQKNKNNFNVLIEVEGNIQKYFHEKEEWKD